jgi:hypothetical protein
VTAENDTTGLDDLIRLGGEAATHSDPGRDSFQILIAPSTTGEFNTIRFDLRPIACVLLKDSRFEFDSSFVSPRAFTQMKALARLRTVHPGAVSTIFGHADPVGDEEYNKRLSGRRAQAIYGLVTRRTELWEDLFSHPAGGDNWGENAIQLMLRELGHAEGSPSERVKSFQTEKGLSPDGKAGPATREALFKAYMDAICVDSDDKPFRLDPKTDFLAGGADKSGKGDFQGCGEFNPTLLVSKADSERFKKDPDKTERNTANRPNRRVMVLLFPRNARVAPGNWPCPRANEGTAGCSARLFGDAAARRANGPAQREFRLTQDTFSCRFYDRMARLSPCESGLAGTLKCHISLLLRSNSGCVPLANRKYKIKISPERTLEGTTDAQGLVQHDDIPAGDYELEIEKHKTFVPATPVFRSRREHQVEGFFLLDDEHFVEDQVLDEKGKPLPNVAMILVKDDNGRERAVTNAEGVARWEKLKTGTARVAFEDESHYPEENSATQPVNRRKPTGTGVLPSPGEGDQEEEGSDKAALDASEVASSRRLA